MVCTVRSHLSMGTCEQCIRIHYHCLTCFQLELFAYLKKSMKLIVLLWACRNGSLEFLIGYSFVATGSVVCISLWSLFNSLRLEYNKQFFSKTRIAKTDKSHVNCAHQQGYLVAQSVTNFSRGLCKETDFQATEICSHSVFSFGTFLAESVIAKSMVDLTYSTVLLSLLIYLTVFYPLICWLDNFPECHQGFFLRFQYPKQKLLVAVCSFSQLHV